MKARTHHKTQTDQHGHNYQCEARRRGRPRRRGQCLPLRPPGRRAGASGPNPFVRHRPICSRPRGQSRATSGLLGLGLELAADVLDMGVDGSLVRFKGNAMDRLEQLSAGEDPARLASEGMKEIEFGGSKNRWSCRRCRTSRRGTSRVRAPALMISAPEPGCVRSPEDRPNPRHQFFGAERFDDVIVGSRVRDRPPGRPRRRGQ